MPQPDQVPADFLQAPAHGSGHLDLGLEQLVLEFLTPGERAETGCAAHVFHERQW